MRPVPRMTATDPGQQGRCCKYVNSLAPACNHLYALPRSAIFAIFMWSLIRYVVAGFLLLVIVFAAFSPDIVLIYERSVKKEDISLAADAGMEKKTSEIKELSPEKEFIENSGFPFLAPGAALKRMFSAFRQPCMHTPYDRIPTPPPRIRSQYTVVALIRSPYL